MAQKTSSAIIGLLYVVSASVLLAGCTKSAQKPVPLPLQPALNEQGVDQLKTEVEGNPLTPEASVSPSKNSMRLPTAAPQANISTTQPSPTAGATDLKSLEKDLGDLKLDSESL